jgi:hypothetical protein
VSDLFEFSWRYQLPALVTLAPAGALGISVLIGAVRDRRRPEAAGGSAQAGGTSAAAPDGGAAGTAQAGGKQAGGTAAGVPASGRREDDRGVERVER